ncbi:MAG TPA: sigma-70 family RNA polymerase sigma factor [Verrucomicrobiae bacterium]|nr:sigma-70 family RNA polymerase sigma factor [Verrucomicrobiae bacterium]
MSGGQPSGWCEGLYCEAAAELLLYGRALGLSHSEAEDVLQETFAALLDRQTPPANPRHYCVRAFRNRALNYRRSLWRRVAREFESLRWFEPRPDEDKNEQAAMRCLADLPADQREVIVLKIWHQYTFEEIGELLDRSPNTIAGRYRYGLQKLKACLTGESHQEYEHHEAEHRTGNPIAFVVAAPPIGEA